MGRRILLGCGITLATFIVLFAAVSYLRKEVFHTQGAAAVATDGMTHQFSAGFEEASLKMMLSSVREQYGNEHPSTIKILRDLAALYSRQGHVPEAKEAMEVAIEVAGRNYGQESQSVAALTGEMGEMLGAHGQYAEALPYLEKSVALLTKLKLSKKPRYSRYLMVLGQTYLFMGQLDKAESHLKEAIIAYTRWQESKRDNVYFAYYPLGFLCLEQGRFEEAETYLKPAVDIYLRRLAVADRRNPPLEAQAFAIDGLMESLYNQKKYDEMIRLGDNYFRQLLAAERADKDDVRMLLYWLAQGHLALGHPEQVENSLALYQELSTAYHLEPRYELYYIQGKLAERNKDTEAAKAGYEKAIRQIETDQVVSKNSRAFDDYRECHRYLKSYYQERQQAEEIRHLDARLEKAADSLKFREKDAA